MSATMKPQSPGTRDPRTAFVDALCADGPAPGPAGEPVYGWLIGSWDLDVSEFAPDGTLLRRRPGEWHFAWVLEGRAIQDVWIVPRRGLRRADPAKHDEYYGSTFRILDPATGQWRIQWTDPVKQAFVTQTGRRVGADIVQEGTDSAGNQRRWSFVDITADGFTWRGEVSADGGATWQKHIEFAARRAGPVGAGE